jgi:tetratricopeptide (TPR) repeat protein
MRKVLTASIFVLICAAAASAQVSASSHAQTWILGMKVSRAAIAYGNGADAAFVTKEFTAAKAAAVRLGVKLDPLPAASPDKGTRISAAVHYLLHLPAWQEIIDKYDSYHGELYEASVKANLLFWYYDTDDNDETRTIEKVLTEISNDNESVWIMTNTLTDKIGRKESYEAISDELIKMDSVIFAETVAQHHFLELGDVFEEQNDFINASKKYTQAILSDPGFSAPYFRRGYCYLKTDGKTSAAIADFTKYIQIAKTEKPEGKDIPSAFLNRGIAYFFQRKYTLAMKDLNEAIRLDPSFGGAFKARSLVNQALGRVAAAKTDMDMAMQLGIAAEQ